MGQRGKNSLGNKKTASFLTSLLPEGLDRHLSDFPKIAQVSVALKRKEYLCSYYHA